MSDKRLEDYRETVGDEALSQLQQLAREFKGARVVHVNSTKMGGGVAEILNWLVPLMTDLGLETSWEVIDGNGQYFDSTKTFHNGLQGNQVVLTETMLKAYEETIEQNAERLRGKLEDADFVFIHDPQPAALFDRCPSRKGKWVWRCHIDASHPNRKVWSYLKKKVSQYDASIFSMPEFAQTLPHPQYIIAPSIDPLSEKNCDVEPEEIEKTLREVDIPNGKPILTQVSRFDRFKDPVGVIEAFKMVREIEPARLVLVGGGATDDPEGQKVYEEVLMAAEDMEDVYVLMLPSDSHRIINCIQRASEIIIQKSTQEGFGLTVTEALWKSRPVVGGNTGGIRSQVQNYFNGFLVDCPEGAALRLRYLLRRPGKTAQMGRRGKQFVRENFLLTRHLREYLTLMRSLLYGEESHILD